jgi:hypothetical protein
MSMSAKITIFRNKKDEEVARVTFDENFPRGWRIESKAHQTLTTSSQPSKRLVTSGIMISTRKLGDCGSGASRHDWFFSCGTRTKLTRVLQSANCPRYGD